MRASTDGFEYTGGAQPPELSPIQALRAAIRAVFAELSPEQLEIDRQRQELILANGELRERMLGEIAGMVNLLAELVAERTGRRSNDLDVRIFAGALMGVAYGLVLTDPELSPKELLSLVDTGLEKLESGLAL